MPAGVNRFYNILNLAKPLFQADSTMEIFPFYPFSPQLHSHAFSAF